MTTAKCNCVHCHRDLRICNVEMRHVTWYITLTHLITSCHEREIMAIFLITFATLLKNSTAKAYIRKPINAYDMHGTPLSHVTCRMPYDTGHMSHVAGHTQHVTPLSHVTCRMPYHTGHMSHVAGHTQHVTPLSHVTCHMLLDTGHMSQATPSMSHHNHMSHAACYMTWATCHRPHLACRTIMTCHMPHAIWHGPHVTGHT